MRRPTNSEQRREVRNYIRWAVRRRRVAAAVARALRVVTARALERTRAVRGRPPYLPEALLDAVTGRAAEGRLPDAPVARVSLDQAVAAPARLSLATADFPAASVRGWDVASNDLEDAYALHRFGWMVCWLAERPGPATVRDATEHVLDWIRSGPRDRRHVAWQSYNVSERMVHWLLLLLVAETQAPLAAPEAATIRESILCQADHLLGHLEYHGPDRTNNHLLNNGRALYMAGALLGSPSHATVGRAILVEESGARFSPSGFLAEGSSHYHLLLTRALLEVLWTARWTGDALLAEALDKPTAAAIRCARFFVASPGCSLPLFGDVSPDSPPEWLRELPSVTQAQPETDAETEGVGWHSLWRPLISAQRLLLESPTPDERDTRGMLGYPDAGWYRCLMPLYAVFWRAAVPATVIESCHAHHDLGSFELHVGGHPVVVDPGRSTYRPTADGLTWRGARSHNSLVVDGWEPGVTRGFNGHAVMLDAYGRHQLHVDYVERGGMAEFEICWRGFERIAGLGAWRRRFFLADDTIRVEDLIEGEGRHRIESFFHFHPTVALVRNADEVMLDAPGASVRLRWTCPQLQSVEAFRMGVLEDGVPTGRYAPRYGATVPAWTLRFRQVAPLPLRSVFEFRVA